jgi:hypothetical protein
MKYFKIPFSFLCFLALFCNIGCQNESANSALESLNIERLNIELLRGDLVLCGGNQFGEVNFFISDNAAIRDTFNLAVSLLHSFENGEAEKAFVKVMDKDPNLAMAYWGVAMSRINPNWGPKREKFDETRKLLKIAESIPKTLKENDYIDAMNAYYYSDWEKTDHRTRTLKVEKKMEENYLKYKDDTEAAIFYALILYAAANPKDKNYTSQIKAGRILESIFPNQPNHPGIAHYIIHNYDQPELAHLALETARRYADIAPASAHAQHMPSHIFTRLGLWDESIKTNLNSQTSAQCYAESAGLDGHWHREVHAIGYLLYAYLQKGDNVRANDLYEYVKTIYKMPPNSDKVAYHFAAAPVRIALENKRWDEAMNVKVHPSTMQWNLFPWQKSLQSFARALGAAHTGDIITAEKELDSLQSFQQELLDKEDQYKANQVMIQIKAAQAWVQYSKGNNEEAIALMLESVDLEDKTHKHAVTPGEVLPARELLGDLLIAMNKPAEALVAYELDLKGHPNRFNGIYGAAVAAKKIGNQEKANMYFEQLLKLTENTGSDRPEIEEANRYLSQI